MTAAYNNNGSTSFIHLPILPPTASMPIGENRPRSSSSDDHSYIDSTMSPSSTAPQTPSEVNPPPQLASPTAASSKTDEEPPSPPEPQNEYIRGLYKAGVPFIKYKDLVITGKLGEVRGSGTRTGTGCGLFGYHVFGNTCMTSYKDRTGCALIYRHPSWSHLD